MNSKNKIENENEDEGEEKILFEVNANIDFDKLKPVIDCEHKYHELTNQQKEIYDSLNPKIKNNEIEDYDILEDDFIELANEDEEEIIKENKKEVNFNEELKEFDKEIKPEFMKNSDFLNIINDDIKELSIENKKEEKNKHINNNKKEIDENKIEDLNLDDENYTFLQKYTLSKVKNNEKEIERKVIKNEGGGTLILRKIKKGGGKEKKNIMEEENFDEKIEEVDEEEEEKEEEYEEYEDYDDEGLEDDINKENGENAEDKNKPYNFQIELKNKNKVKEETEIVKNCPFKANDEKNQIILDKLHEEYLKSKQKKTIEEKKEKIKIQPLDKKLKNNIIELHVNQEDDNDEKFLKELEDRVDKHNNLGKCELANENNKKPDNYYCFNIVKEEIEIKQKKNKKLIKEYNKERIDNINKQKEKYAKEKEIIMPKVVKNESPNTKKERKELIKKLKKEKRENKKQIKNKFKKLLVK